MVRRKADNVVGTMTVQDIPLYFIDFRVQEEEHGIGEHPVPAATYQERRLSSFGRKLLNAWELKAEFRKRFPTLFNPFPMLLDDPSIIKRQSEYDLRIVDSAGIK